MAQFPFDSCIEMTMVKLLILLQWDFNDSGGGNI